MSEVATDLFEDVVDDFCDTDSVREKFYDWKNKYGDTYKEAYIGLCLPKLVNPFVRLQLINWNPLQVTKLAFLCFSHWFLAITFLF